MRCGYILHSSFSLVLGLVLRERIKSKEIRSKDNKLRLDIPYNTAKMSTFGLHRLDWLMISKRSPWNAKYETVYRWLATFVVIYTIMNLKS